MDDYDTLDYVLDDLKVVHERLRGLNDEMIVDHLIVYVETIEDLINEIDSIRDNIARNGGEYV